MNYYNVDEYAKKLRVETNRMLEVVKPLIHVLVHDLPDVPEENTVYHLEQTWIYMEAEGWIRTH